MTVLYDYDVEEWLYSTSPAIVSPNSFSWAQVKYFNIHYIGAGRYAGKNEVQILNSIQQDYVSSRGYSFGYSSAAGLSGSTYEGRGENYRPASNGDDDVGDDDIPGNPQLLDNKEVFSCLAIIGADDELTDKLIEGINRLYRQMPANVVVNVHSDMDATGCPGDKMRAAVKAGRINRNSVGGKLVEKFTVLNTPDRFYDSRVNDDKQPISGGTTTFGIKKYDGINYPSAVEVTVTAIPQKIEEGDGFLGMNSNDSFINWKQSDIGRPMPQTVWLPVSSSGLISIYTQDTIHIILSVRAYG